MVLLSGEAYVLSVWEGYPTVKTYFFVQATEEEKVQEGAKIILYILRHKHTTGKEIDQVEGQFTPTRLHRAWVLFYAFGFDTSSLKARFQAFCDTRGDLAETQPFLEWGLEVLQPLINERIKRAPDDPTFYAIMHHLIEEHTGGQP